MKGKYTSPGPVMQTVLLAITLVLCIVLAANGPEAAGPVAKLSHHQDDSLKRSLLIKPISELSAVADLAKIDAVVSKKTSESDTVEKLAPKRVGLAEIAKAALANHFGVPIDAIDGIDEGQLNGARKNESEERLSPEELARRFIVTDELANPKGLFVTFSRDGKTRACWGNLYPAHRDMVRATIYTTEDALKKEYRFAPVKKNEIATLNPQVTVVREIVPISSLRDQQPLKQGLFVRSGGRGAVLLPGEASDPHYQLVQCKLKAGIPSNTQCQMYRVEADVYR